MRVGILWGYILSLGVRGGRGGILVGAGKEGEGAGKEGESAGSPRRYRCL